jgi:hypothetical protein
MKGTYKSMNSLLVDMLLKYKKKKKTKQNLIDYKIFLNWLKG